MAKRTNIDERQGIFLGTDTPWELIALNRLETVAIDITGWAVSLMIKRKATDPDSRALIHKTTAAGDIVIGGLYSSDPDGNTLTAVTTIAAAETEALVPQMAVYEWKRTDPGYETPLAYGTVPLIRSVHHG